MTASIVFGATGAMSAMRTFPSCHKKSVSIYILYILQILFIVLFSNVRVMIGLVARDA